MNLIRIFLLTLCASSIAIPSGAQVSDLLKGKPRSSYSNTTVSLFTNYSTGSVQYEYKVGAIGDRARSMTVGFGISKAFYLRALPPDVYVSIGLRQYLARTRMDFSTAIYGSKIKAFNEVEVTHQFISIPVYLGKTLYSKGRENALNLFGGASFGTTGISKIYSYSGAYSNLDNNEEILVESTSRQSPPGRNVLYAALEGGATYAFARKLPGLSFGISATCDLVRTPRFDYEGTYFNPKDGSSDTHRYSFFSRYVHASLSANYTFGKKWKAQR